MTAALPVYRVRLKLDVTDTGSILDAFRNKLPSAWRNSDIQLELGIFVKDEVADLTALASVTAIIRASRTGTKLIERLVDDADFNTALTAEQWAAGTHQHITIKITAAEASLSGESFSDDKLSTWMVFTCLTKDTPAYQFTLAGTTFTFYENGSGGEFTSPEVPDDFYTKPESEARFVPQWGNQANMRWDNGWLLYFPDDGTWRKIIGTFKDGQPTFGFGDPVS